MDIYLVEDCGNNPGRVYAVMADDQDAQLFAAQVEKAQNTRCEVIERKLYYGQPPRPGLCP